MDNKELLKVLSDVGYEATSHMASIEDDVIDKVKNKLQKGDNNKSSKPNNKPSSDRDKKPSKNFKKDYKGNIEKKDYKSRNNSNGGNNSNGKNVRKDNNSKFTKDNNKYSKDNRSNTGRMSKENKDMDYDDDINNSKRRDVKGKTVEKRSETVTEDRSERAITKRNDKRNNDKRDKEKLEKKKSFRGDSESTTNDTSYKGKIGTKNKNVKNVKKVNKRAPQPENTKLTNINSVLNNSHKKKKKKDYKRLNAKNNEEVEEIIEDDIKVAKVSKMVTVKELADAIDKSVTDIIMILMKKGIMANQNQTIEFDLAVEIADENDYVLEEFDEKDVLETFFEEEDTDELEDLEERPPVVVVMGHVDHGKTSLLDAIRDAHVIKGEAGGITQHIGAYTVKLDGKTITFLDTPGHAAFTAMRMRGASVTDIAVLVVAADDGVMPQTIEAINHAKAAGVEIIVAINKIDKPNANPDRVKQELIEHGILVEDWGGNIISVPVSALKGDGIEDLLSMITLTAEVQELKANHQKKARGTVIEAALDKGRGSVATVLVQNGTLHVGDPIVVGCAHGRVRAMIDDKGNKVKSAGPSIPVEILGLSDVPNAGDSFYTAKNEREARQLAESVIAKTREDMIKDTPQKVSLNDLFNQIQLGTVKELNIVIKADVQGSVEAIRSSLEKLSDEEVMVKIIHGGVGAITESDVMLASASNAIIIGFNVRPEPSAKQVAENEKVDLRLYRVIYNALEDITTAMKGLLDPVFEEKVIGHVEIRQIFKASGVGTIAGSYVLDGKVTRNSHVRVIRDGVVVYEGTLDTLKRFKDDVKEVATGYECGLLFNRFNDIKEGDQVEAFIMEEVKR